MTLFFRRRTSLQPSAFQMAPMIDCVFTLLCFSLASQIYARWETEVNITLPTAQTGEIPRRLPGEIILNVRQNGDVVFNGRRLEERELVGLLQQIVALFPNQPVLIRGDAKTAYENIIRVLDVCRRVDLWNISFATGVPEHGPDKGS